MDNGNPRDAGATGAGRLVYRKPLILGFAREQLLGFILVVLALGYGIFALVGWHSAKVQQQAGDDYSAFMAAVAKADEVADPLQRCLSYPDLPQTHWNPDATRAYCIYRNHKTVRWQDIEALLKDHKSAEVDRIFQGYLDAQQHDPDQQGLLDIAFYNAGFEDADDNVRRVIDMWKQQSPNSAFALAASGVQYVDAAQQARGGSYANELDDQQVNGMNQQVALAFKDLERAVSIDKTITPVYAAMIHAAGIVGDDDDMYRAANLGVKVAPADFGIRIAMMNYAEPRWGSSFGGMEQQRAKDLEWVSKNPLLRMVAQDPLVDHVDMGCPPANIHGCVEQAIDSNLNSDNLIDVSSKVYDTDRRLAVLLFSEALRFDPTDVDALRWRSQEMIALGDKQGATATFAEVARRFPENNAMADDLANIYARAGDVKDAEATLLAVLQRDPDNYYGMGVLGDLYNHAGHQPDKAEALADRMIKEYPEKPGGYIVRSCNQMDHNLPGVYDTIHYFIDHFGDDAQWKSQTEEMRAYLVKHPEKVTS